MRGDDLPAGWAWATLGEVCDVIGGITVDAKRAGDGMVEVPYLRVANVQRGRLDLKRMRTILVPGDRLKHLSLKAGDVLLNEGGDRDKVGRGWVWEGQISPCVFQNHVFRARGRGDALNPYFLSHFLNEFARDHFLTGAKQTTNLASISLSAIKATPILIAPSAEQERVVAAINDQFTDLDTAEAALGRAREGVEQFRASLLHAACTGALTAAWRDPNPIDPSLDKTGADLLRRILAERRATWERTEHARLTAKGTPPKGDAWKARYVEPAPADDADLPALPAGWMWAALEQVCEIVGGITVDSKRDGIDLVEVPYLRVANVQRGYLKLQQMKTIKAPPAAIQKLALRPNDLLMNEGGDRDKLGRGWVWRGEIPNCIHQNHVYRARPYLASVDARFISHYFNEIGRAFFFDAATQTVNLASVNMSKVSRAPVPIPPAAEIAEIMCRIDDMLEQTEGALAEAEQASQLRQSILHAAFTGRLVPQDPADEPAAALLARLRAAPPPARRTRAPRQASRV